MKLSAREQVGLGVVIVAAFVLLFTAAVQIKSGQVSTFIEKTVVADGGLRIVEPQAAHVALKTIPGKTGTIEPALVVFADAGERCEKVSPLVATHYVSDGVLYIDVGAYAIKEEPNQSRECNGSPKLSQALIPLLEVFNGHKELPTKIILRDSSNGYLLTRDAYAIYLEPIVESNVTLAPTDTGAGENLLVCLKKTTDQRAPAACRE